MEKITEKVLLAKSSPKSSKLEEIHSLNLSRLGLQCEDLPVPLLSRLQSLESLDLSGNRLTQFPVSLQLPALKQLNLSDNQIEDVTSLQCLTSVEELRMEDNLYITVSDNYKLMVLLPQLRMYNGKDITTNANHIRYVFCDNLHTRIVSLWEQSFKLPKPMSSEKMAVLEKDFVSTAKRQVKFGPSSVSDFTKWRVGIMAAEFLKSLTQEKDKPPKKVSTAPEDSKNSTPAKRKRAESPATIRLTPVKKAPVSESPSKKGLRLTPQKVNQMNSPCKASAPSRGRAKAECPQRGLSIQQNEEQSHMGPAQKIVPAANSGHSQGRVCMRPLHALQCHSKQDSPDDFSTQLWACAFKPSPYSDSQVVATCGGDSVCLIHCKLGVVIKKYHVPGEEFFSLAWTTLLMSRGQGASAQPCSILAAGGKKGLVKFIHPKHNIAYGEIKASNKAVSVLRFNPNKGNFLYTGSYDNKIKLWDVGGLDIHYNYNVVQVLTVDCSSTPLHFCIPPKAPLSHLLTAFEDGLHCYNTKHSSTNSKWKQVEITFPVYEKEDSEHDYHTVDGLSFLSDDVVASKNYTHGCIYLWSWSQTIAQKPDKNKTVCAVILTELQWANTEVPYLALNTCPGQSYVVCGDDKGRVWTYHINDIKSRANVPQILDWPAPSINGGVPMAGTSINSVTMDPDLQYLVALTDKNLVLVWKRVESEQTEM